MDTKQLEKFKEILESRKQEILNQLYQTNKDIEDLYNSEPNDNIDFSVITASSQIEETIDHNLKQELEYIENSLLRIKKGNYGICEGCEEEINIERLKIKPHARYCINCREKYEKSKGL
ncbi:RNA polymerase-binding protein DksA [Campylobacter sp. MIT 99-7217]|uniref:RNA polymerase-binding protein DksA n=1 Tax=Campylobacter sp. MIT 99-7217 TaxID=535091 RepID=UPI0011582698|nr:RNA polymerase-binding protein DksA [Campylobacter sp. MIT 99-7217]TQR31278.1 RNA polymerase-binding protein DksA [Campylobacter sp. MIT 99-7217]